MMLLASINAQHKFNASIVTSTVLQQTNIIRNAYNLKPLKWNTQVSESLQSWADTCPPYAHGHLTLENREATGQNLASFAPCDDMIGCQRQLVAWSWFSEEYRWNYNVSSPAFEDAYGHFFIMMGNSVKNIACGASACNSNMGIIWCNYWPVSTPILKMLTLSEMTSLKNTLASLGDTKWNYFGFAPCDRAYCGPIY